MDEKVPLTNGAGTHRRRRPTVWSGLVVLVVAGLSVASALLLRQGVDRQSTALLRNSADQIQILLQTSLSTVQGQLRAAAALANGGADEKDFDSQATALRTQPSVTVALVDTAPAVPTVVLVQGAGLQVGPLPAGLIPTAMAAKAALTGMLVHLGTTDAIALASAPTTDPRYVAMELSPVNPTVQAPGNTGPYSHVYVDIYASATADAHAIVITTYGPKPLPGQVVTASLQLGSLHWLIAVSPIGSLVGGYAQSAPWIVLVIGLVVALMAAVLVEFLARRQEYAQALVAERTAELVEAQRAMVRQERLAAIGELASVVSHELRNPLSAVVNDLFLLRHRLGDALDDATSRYLSNAEDEVFRASRLSEELLAYTREREAKIAPVDFDVVVAGVLESTPPPQGIEVTVGESTRLQADGGLLTQILTNLVTNAYQAMPDGGTVRIAASRHDDSAVISVSDEGPGVDEAVRDSIFDPFVTTRDEGTGLGLAIVHRLVAAHGGEVSVENQSGGGARFSVTLPGQRAS